MCLNCNCSFLGKVIIVNFYMDVHPNFCPVSCEDLWELSIFLWVLKGAFITESHRSRVCRALLALNTKTVYTHLYFSLHD
jgi:hypothetical protein